MEMMLQGAKEEVKMGSHSSRRPCADESANVAFWRAMQPLQKVRDLNFSQTKATG